MHLTLRIFCDILILQCDLQVTFFPLISLIAKRNAILTDLMLFFYSIAFCLSFIYLKEKELSHTKQLFTLWQSTIITYK